MPHEPCGRIGLQPVDFYQEDNDASLFLLIECYRDEAALHAHRASAHYLAFRADVTDWVTERHWWYWNTGLREREAVLVRLGFP